ncbi:MAG TPA: SRPBCC family protein [Burkholderiaceae bacterium]|nr:SRPBCC family protein [Burkholderiaceae bacterium]
MASIHQELRLDADPTAVWDAVRDVGAVHTRVAPGFLTACRMEDAPRARIVSFANGMEARELIVDVDDAARRLVWAVVGGRMTHHNASMQVFGEGERRTRVVWIADLLPDELAPAIGAMIGQGLAAMKQRFEH